jgi:hypothetical protein
MEVLAAAQKKGKGDTAKQIRINLRHYQSVHVKKKIKTKNR